MWPVLLHHMLFLSENEDGISQSPVEGNSDANYI